MLTLVPRQHVLKLNKHGNINKSPPINIYFLIAGLENKYFFGKLERPWAHELTSETGGELMSWSPSVSAALILTQAVVRYLFDCQAKLGFSEEDHGNYLLFQSSIGKGATM